MYISQHLQGVFSPLYRLGLLHLKSSKEQIHLSMLKLIERQGESGKTVTWRAHICFHKSFTLLHTYIYLTHIFISFTISKEKERSLDETMSYQGIYCNPWCEVCQCGNQQPSRRSDWQCHKPQDCSKNIHNPVFYLNNNEFNKNAYLSNGCHTKR